MILLSIILGLSAIRININKKGNRKMGLKKEQLKEAKGKNSCTLKNIVKNILKYFILFGLGIIIISFLLFLLMPILLKIILIIFVVLIIIGIITIIKKVLK